MAKKTDKNPDVVPDSIFLAKEMGKRIKFILKLENLYQNRDDLNGYYCGKICEDNPFFSIKLNDASRAIALKELLSKKYHYFVNDGESTGELIIKSKPILDPSDLQIDDEIKKQEKKSFDNFDSDNEDDPKLKILRSRYKKIIGAIRYHFPMGYGFNQNNPNGYKATRIKNSDEKSFFMQFPTSDLADSISHFLFKNGHKTLKSDPNTLEIFLEEFPEESQILNNLLEDDFTSEQLNKIWDMLNTNGLVLLDVNSQYSILDLFNGKGLSQISKEQFVQIIKNQ